MPDSIKLSALTYLYKELKILKISLANAEKRNRFAKKGAPNMIKKLLAEWLMEKYPEKMDAIINGDEAMTKDMEDEFWGWCDTRNA